MLPQLALYLGSTAVYASSGRFAAFAVGGGRAPRVAMAYGEARDTLDFLLHGPHAALSDVYAKRDEYELAAFGENGAFEQLRASAAPFRAAVRAEARVRRHYEEHTHGSKRHV